MTVTRDQAQMLTDLARVLPWDFPGAPPAPDYPYQRTCRGLVELSNVPGGYDLKDIRTVGATAVYCTRDPHSVDEMHVCHLRDNDGEPVSLIVWGGE